MPTLSDTITRAATAFAAQIVDAVRGATLAELMALQAGTAKSGKKRGRPAKAPKTAKAKPRKKMTWPRCKHPGCKKNAWRRGNGFCGEHFRASKAG